MAEWPKNQLENGAKKIEEISSQEGVGTERGAEKKPEEKVEKAEWTKEKSDEGMTRRAFLAKSLSTVMRAGLATLLPKEAWAGLAEIQEREGKIEKGTFEDVAFELFRKVYSEKDEQIRYFLRADKEFDTGVFFSGKTREGNYQPKGSSGDYAKTVTPPLAIKAFLENPHDLEELAIFHTHPVDSSGVVYDMIPSDVVDDLDRSAIRSAPFSAQDLISFLGKLSSYPESIKKYSEVVVEPTGYWRMKADSQNEKIKEFLETKQKEIKLFKNADPKIKQSLKNEASSEIEKLVNKKIKPEEFPDEFFNLGTDLDVMASQLVEFFDRKQREIFIDCPLGKAGRLEKIQEFINEAAERGIILEYTPLKFEEKK